MLECKINIVPKGYRDLTRNVATVRVINDGTGNMFVGNYRIEYETDKNPETKYLSLHGFDRSKDAGELYQEVFSLIYGKEKKE